MGKVIMRCSTTLLSLGVVVGNISLASATAIREHEIKRAACNQDNVLRALEANAGAASPFCSSYIGIPVYTVYKPIPGSTFVL